MSEKTKFPKKDSTLETPLEELEIGSVIYLTNLTSKFRNRKMWKPYDEKKVYAFIPGTIQKIFVKKGDEVSIGAPIIILEAMKMRNEITSPVQGVVNEIYVSEGDMVPNGHLIMDFQ